MLMKAPYKTADNLGISDKVYEALLETKRQLECGFIEPCMFYMGAVREHPMECGTIACIGGWVGINMNLGVRATHNMVNFSYGPIRDLYFPGTVVMRLGPSIAQAAEAIGNFLLTGDPMWDDVMAIA